VLLPLVEITIDGQPAPPKFMQEMTECTVENSLHLPDMCTIRLTDDEFKFIDDASLSEGKSIEVKAGFQGQTLQSIFKGEIVGLEFDLASHTTPTMIIRSFNKAHRLHHGRITKTYLNVKDSDLARQVAGTVGLQAQVDDTGALYEHVLQYNQTNWEFLSLRALRAGCRLYVEDDKLYFKKVKKDGNDEVEVEWGKNLISFRPHTAATPQVSKVIVRGWDPTKKEPISAEVAIDNAKSAPAVSLTPRTAAGAFGSSSTELVITDQPVHSVQEAQNIAQSVADSIAGDYLTAEGLCMGDPKLRPNNSVKVSNIGSRFSGKYYITATTHIYSPAEGSYKTLFSVSGKHPNTVLGLLENGNQIPKPAQGGNIVVGLVTNNKSSGARNDMGWIKVKYPWLGDDIESGWIRVASQMAGSGRGMFNLPEIDDEVLVAFEHGDVNRPYMIAQLWNGKDKLPSGETGNMVAGGKVERRGFYTRIGHKLVFNDLDGKGDITITTSNDHKITMDDKNQKVVVETKTGHKVEMDDAGSKITVVDKTGSNKMTISSNDNSIKLECNGNFTIDAKGKVNIKGLAGVDVNTPAMMNLEASAVTTIKGSIVKIN
jgi:phage protein D/phage baseplate assembly protein gpV